MNLPIQIKRVSYEVAGSYMYRGNLIIMREIIYYFPLENLKKSGSIDEGTVAWGILGVPSEDSWLYSHPPSTKLLDYSVGRRLVLKTVWRNKTAGESLRNLLDDHY